MRIAIVDDCLDDRLDVALCLDQYMHAHHLTYTLTEFDNATSFLQLVPHVNFDVVFMDIYMPDMNGIDVAKKLRDRDKHCKIILMTITEDFARMGYGLAATYYLLKPVSDYPSDFEEAMALCQLKPPMMWPRWQSPSVHKHILCQQTRFFILIIKIGSLAFTPPNGSFKCGRAFKR